MKNMKYIFANDRYKNKIYNVANLRLLSFEIYKLFVFYFLMSLISWLSYRFPFSLFFQIDYNFLKLMKILTYLLIIDIFYFISFKSNQGLFSVMEIIINSLFKPNVLKILPTSFSFCLLYLITKEIKSLMPSLDSEYIKAKYNIEPYYRDEYEEIYYSKKGISKKTAYEYSDGLFVVCVSLILLIHFILLRQKYDLWPKLDLCRITNLKNKLRAAIKNIIIIGIPAFLIIYFIFIFYYHYIFIIGLSIDYSCVFILEYNILFISMECLHNFICSKISYVTKEVNNKTQLIKIEVDFEKEETFYIIHHLKHLNDLFKYPHDIKTNTNLLNPDNLNCIKNKIFFFFNSLNRKYSKFLSKVKPFNINSYMNAFERIKIILQKFFDYFDYSANQVFENDTCIEIMKLLIELNGNITIFLADATIIMPQEEKYMKYCDHIYFFIERLFEMDRLFLHLIQSKKISEQLRKDLYKLRISIINYFDLIRDRQNKYEFIKLETEKIKELLYRN